MRRLVIVDHESSSSQLFDKSSFSPSHRRFEAAPARSGSERAARSKTGQFLDRLFPHGDFLDGLAGERPGRISFYLPMRPSTRLLRLSDNAPSGAATLLGC